MALQASSVINSRFPVRLRNVEVEGDSAVGNVSFFSISFVLYEFFDSLDVFDSDALQSVRVEEEDLVSFLFASRTKSMNCGSTPCNNKLSREMEAGRTFDVEVGIETVRVEEEEFVAFFFASRIKSMNCGSTPCNNKLSRETEEDERMDVVEDVPSVLLVSEVDFDN